MAVQSGVPTTVNGVQVGATDFREFDIGPGLPAGITAIGSVPASVGINDAPISPSFTDEGKYFEMLTPITFNVPWAFTLDAFDGILEQGELLARVLSNFSTTENRRCIGPGMSLQDLGGVNGAASGFIDAFTSGELEVSGVRFVGGGVGTIGFFSALQPIQEDEWMWLRIRKTNNAGTPSNDDWTVTAWYGDIEDEPASPTGVDLNNSDGTPRGLFGIGWGYSTPGSTFSQRIAFLSYSENPDVEPPPTEIGTPTVWTNFPRRLVAGQAKPTIPNAVVEYDVRNIGFPYNDGDVVTDWEDLVTSNPQGRLDATGSNPGAAGTPNFVADGWTPGIDAVRFSTPVPDILAFIDGGIGNSDWVGNAYTIFGVMEATDIANFAVLIGGNAGLSPLFPKKTIIFVQPDGSVVFHHTGEVSVQSGSVYSVETEAGIVEPGDRLIITATASSTEGKVLRINGEQVGVNPLAGSTFNQEFVNPGIGGGYPQEVPDVLGTISGDDRLIVWLAGYQALASLTQIEAMESFLTGAFQLNFATQWTDKPAVSPGTVWANIS